MKRCVMSARSKEDLTAMVNEYFYSKNYIITDDGKVYNTVKKKAISNWKVVNNRDRWKIERCN